MTRTREGRGDGADGARRGRLPRRLPRARRGTRLALAAAPTFVRQRGVLHVVAGAGSTGLRLPAIAAALWCSCARTGRSAAAKSVTRAVAAFAACCALAVAIRPNNVVIVGPLALLMLRRHPARGRAQLAAALGAAALLAYNEPRLRHGERRLRRRGADDLDFAGAIPGLLLSPGRGLLVSSRDVCPGAAAGAGAARSRTIWRWPRARRCRRDAAAHRAWPNWWGGYSWRPRLSPRPSR